MPKREDIHSILILGSGPIVIGQACEFDYSGTQGCKALRQEGYRVILVNSNPATIMTDPDTGDSTYIEPLDVPTVTKIIEKERPDCILPTLGGQTALNLAIDLSKAGVLDKYGIELIGAKREAIEKAEDREQFKNAMQKIGLDVPKSFYARNYREALEMAREVGFPTIIRPSFTLGGTGAGIAYNREELESWLKWALDQSPVHEVLIEESVLGWKEYELEVMRDMADNVVIICSIENFDAMGIHTGDSITVAPAQTLTDREYQKLRNASIAVIREIGVDTGGSNIQFAVNPKDGRVIVIEMNPRVSRSSALASKATGFPIAKIAAKLAVGYTLDELPNDITGETPASFEPSIDYVVVKIPRWNFDKFPGSEPRLGLQMKSVGEAMAIGRSFQESLQKALRSLEIGRFGLGGDGKDKHQIKQFLQGETIQIYREIEALKRNIEQELRFPGPERIFHIRYAFQLGMSVQEVFELTGTDPWFLENVAEIVEMERSLQPQAGSANAPSLRIDTADGMLAAKQKGFSDRQLAFLTDETEQEIRYQRKNLGVTPVYKIVDTCAAEFAAQTPYLYSSYEKNWVVVNTSEKGRETVSSGRDSEVLPNTGKKKVMILGGGPNRIGQGIEFDYCCCHAVFALKEMGYETIMVNSNPETVSTDYDTSDRLYFEPLTFEDVLNIYEAENPIGVILQFGGQTPLNLALSLQSAGVNVLGTDPKNIHKAEDRKHFARMLDELKIPYPPAGTAQSLKETREIVNRIGYPVLLRPSYVLGGRAMVIVHQEEELESCFNLALEASPEHPVLIDKFLDESIEVDVDAICDGENVYIGGIMEHIEYAGVHSGDSACVIPPHTLSEATIQTIRNYTTELALAFEVRGLMNIQYAVSPSADASGQPTVYVLEVNPRASRTVPFVSKATGVPLAKVAARVMLGQTLKEQGVLGIREMPYLAVKEAVLPFVKFPGVDIILGPEMKSTGEVMGIGKHFGTAFAKAEAGAWCPLPDPRIASAQGKKVFLSVNDRHKKQAVEIARGLKELGFNLICTTGTHTYLKEHGIETEQIFKVSEGRPNVLDCYINDEICLVINTPRSAYSHKDEMALRRGALERGITYMTTIAASRAALEAIRSIVHDPVTVQSIQEYQALTRFV